MNPTGTATVAPGAAGFAIRATSAFTASRPIAEKSWLILYNNPEIP